MNIFTGENQEVENAAIAPSITKPERPIARPPFNISCFKAWDISILDAAIDEGEIKLTISQFENPEFIYHDKAAVIAMAKALDIKGEDLIK